MGLAVILAVICSMLLRPRMQEESPPTAGSYVVARYFKTWIVGVVDDL
jgi:hypothetical protein